MNRKELVIAIAEETSISQAAAGRAVDAFMKAVGDALIAGEKVVLIGFGTFAPHTSAERSGINPSTKEKIQIKAKTRAKFKAGKTLNNLLN